MRSPSSRASGWLLQTFRTGLAEQNRKQGVSTPDAQVARANNAAPAMDKSFRTIDPPPEVRARSESLAHEGHSHHGFSLFATQIASLTGRPATFALAVGTILVWAISGPIFRFSDTWQLVINTGTTIVTFLMVFVIQNAQNRDAMAIQVKLDELICATKDARDKLVGIEDMDDVAVERLKAEIQERSAQAQHAADAG